jgi:hypothetical protein
MINKSILVLTLLFVSPALTAQTPRPSCEMFASRDKVFFYDEVRSGGRIAYVKRKAYLVYGDRFWVDCRAADRDWVYVQFRNRKGVLTRGYLRGSDMDYVR